ncbi:hypothetical protein [Pseudomonas sp. PDM22]|uniref:hypothetical protein n=1 Tax=Pseudomonas sp. PDM22 TaxID=2769287 RepID=UPI001782CE61|nr:hypothetical protein [Pseudomonas sp. PDM22]MBD9515037.1 hypothetical protein [Pseudomonas sp. PDM22]
MNIEFKSSAGVLSFCEEGFFPSEGIADFSIRCEFHGKYSGLLDRVFYCRLYRADASRLLDCYDSRVATVNEGGAFEPYFYMPLDNDFQVAFLAGEAESKDDGYFFVSFMFNLGGKDDESSNVYFGFEAEIDFLDMKKFCNDLASIFSLSKD